MLTLPVICDVISLFATRKSSCLPSDLRNFNEIFRKNVSYDKKPVIKNQGFPLSVSRKCNFANPQPF